MARTVQCAYIGREAPGLERIPYPGELGKRIYENVSKEAWQGWLKHQTMLVNENRLSLADARARKWLAEQMEQHFFGGGAAPNRNPRSFEPKANRALCKARVRQMMRHQLGPGIDDIAEPSIIRLSDARMQRLLRKRGHNSLQLVGA